LEGFGRLQFVPRVPTAMKDTKPVDSSVVSLP
jgi:hypothetical protein